MNSRVKTMLSSIAVFAALCTAAAQTGTLPSQASAAIDKAIEDFRSASKAPAVSVAIAFRNQPIYAKAFGMADLEHRVAATPETLFRTASIAKPLTATAVMALAEDGRLDLDAPITRYCAAWPASHPVITARQLLAHLGGVRHYVKAGESSGTTTYFSIEESLALFKNDPLLHAPGSKYSYTTYGYSVLGCAIEGASGMTYPEFMRTRVFERAGMASTRQDFHYYVIPNRAEGYWLMTDEVYGTLPASAKALAKPGTIYNAQLHDTSMKVPGGGLLSTPSDLVRFGIAVTTGTLLKPATVEQMWTEQKTSAGEGTGTGLGWGVTPAQDGIRRLSHSGNQAGAAGVLHVLPEVGLSYAILTNLEDAQLGPLSRAIAGILREHMMKDNR